MSGNPGWATVYIDVNSKQLMCLPARVCDAYRELYPPHVECKTSTNRPLGSTANATGLPLESCVATGHWAVLHTVCSDGPDKCHAQFDMEQVLKAQHREIVLLGSVAFLVVMMIAVYMTLSRHRTR